jgi:hypothetical protein
MSPLVILSLWAGMEICLIVILLYKMITMVDIFQVIKEISHQIIISLCAVMEICLTVTGGRTSVNLPSYQGNISSIVILSLWAGMEICLIVIGLWKDYMDIFQAVQLWIIHLTKLSLFISFPSNNLSYFAAGDSFKTF